MATKTHSKAETAIRFAKQAERLSLHTRAGDNDEHQETTAVGAHFVTPADPVIELASGDRLPAVPLTEAQKLNELKSEVESHQQAPTAAPGGALDQANREKNAYSPEFQNTEVEEAEEQGGGDFERPNTSLSRTRPPARTNPLFPPLPLYGPPTLLRTFQCYTFRVMSFILSLGFLAGIVVGSAVTSLPLMFKHIWIRLNFQDPDARRPFYEAEKKAQKERQEAAQEWRKDLRRKRRRSQVGTEDSERNVGHQEQFIPTEGGKDPLVCDPAYYARRVGLDIEEYKVQTEDGFIITLWHVYNPLEHTPASEEERSFGKPAVFPDDSSHEEDHARRRRGKRRYPVLMMHGLLQCSGSYCTNDDKSLAFFLAKSGYDVWLGNNRCGLKPEHKLLKYGDPRFWAWNIRQMGVLDLPAFISRVLSETGFSKLGLVCHSQGTTQTFVALAKEQRPDLGEKISVFCALAPAVYAGPLIGKMYFKFMRLISPAMFRIFFGIHAFIPFMMTMHARLPVSLYSAMGYRVFSFLLNWTDERWDRGLRDRFFRFAPVYVSAESMRWWLGRECFARHKCILATRDDRHQEDVEDEEEDAIRRLVNHDVGDRVRPADEGEGGDPTIARVQEPEDRGRLAWYDERAPPFAFWIAGSDELVDGRRLLRRFEHGREPHVDLVHAKVIEEYEHLDVLWAMDVVEKVGVELREVLWRTASAERHSCITPTGCDSL